MQFLSSAQTDTAPPWLTVETSWPEGMELCLWHLYKVKEQCPPYVRLPHVHLEREAVGGCCPEQVPIV